MAYSIFTNTTAFKAIVGGSVNDSFDIEYISPFFDETHAQRMEMWVGTTLYDALVDGVANDDLTADEEALLPYYQKALGWLTLHDYLSFAEVQVTGSGISRVENENYKSAYKDQVKAIKERCLQNGMEALERLLIYLEANKATLTDWPDAPGYDKYHGVLLNTANAFRMVNDKLMYRQVFESMLGAIEDAEQFALVPLLGQDQYDALLDARKTATWTSEALEKKAILLSQKISAHFALKDALVRNYVRLDANRVVQVEYLAEQAVPKEGTASANAVGFKRELHDDRANAYIKALRTFLDANEDDAAFADYKAWKAELAEAEEAYQAARETEYASATTTAADTSERGDWGTAFGLEGAWGTARKGASRL